LDEILRASHDQAEINRMIGITPEGDTPGKPQTSASEKAGAGRR